MLYLLGAVYSIAFWVSLVFVTSGIYLKIRTYTLLTNKANKCVQQRSVPLEQNELISQSFKHAQPCQDSFNNQAFVSCPCCHSGARAGTGYCPET